MRLLTAAMAWVFFVAGCGMPPHPKPKATAQETVSAISTVTQGLTNKPLTQQDLDRLKSQAERNPEAQSALRSINSALTPEHTVKYCPENGERYSPDMTYCSDGKVKLEWVD
jgi:hypothetical protein